MTQWKLIDNSKLSNRAQEYFGGDVQHFSFYKVGPWSFEIRQQPHWGNTRVAARVGAETQREAIKELNEMAKFDDARYA